MNETIINFISKRNKVYYSKKNNYVVKCFENSKDYYTEKEVYYNLKLKGFKKIPKLIDCKDKQLILYLQYINGITVLEMLEKCEKNNDFDKGKVLIVNVLKWLDKFYKYINNNKLFKNNFDNTKLDKNKLNNDKFVNNELIYINNGIGLGDVNLRNFIYFNNNVYGIDFENIRKRNLVEEKLEVLARFLLYDPIKTIYKYKIVDEVLKDFFGKENYIYNNQIIERYISKIMKYRYNK